MIAPSVKVTVDRERTMCMTWGSNIAFEKATGLKMSRLDVKALGMYELAALVWSALLKDDPTLTIEQVADMIHPGNQQDVLDAFTRLQEANAKN